MLENFIGRYLIIFLISLHLLIFTRKYFDSPFFEELPNSSYTYKSIHVGRYLTNAKEYLYLLKKTNSWIFQHIIVCYNAHFPDFPSFLRTYVREILMLHIQGVHKVLPWPKNFKKIVQVMDKEETCTKLFCI